ncbi:peptidase S8/S53 domain-containing protein [Aspergillus pseudoustus]|uniref:Alkaline protease 1 n=1 Tax=Aspergillus pseudoustus TaxID=1810923 RepID=A0ABR4J638_9EURO
MRGFRRCLVLVAAALPFVFSAPVAQNQTSAPEVIPGRYIVTLKKEISSDTIIQHRSWVSSILADSDAIENVITVPSFNAYFGSFSDAVIDRIKSDSAVERVEPDHVWHLSATVSQEPAPWGLRSISDRKPGAPNYVFDERGGLGTFAYVVDTGINYGHVEFEGRAHPGFVAVPGPDVDTYGHGTHVAGTIGSRAYGVAKKTQLISVKVFLGESSSTSIILLGYAWAINDIVTKNRQAVSAINMSIGGSFSETFNAVVAAADVLGVTTVVAAGNEGVPAITTSPASSPHAITVGAIAPGNVKASFSNWGTALDIFAPGVDVLSTYIGSPVAVTTMSGTSMASPHVCGLAVYLKSLEFLPDRKTTAARIATLATKGAVVGEGAGSPNRLAFNGGPTLGPVIPLNTTKV